MIPTIRRTALFASVLVIVALLLRLPIAVSASRIVDADEAVNALEAMHIAQGRSFPIYFYGTDYLGVAELYVAAGLFKILGISGFVARLPSLLLSLIFVIQIHALGRRWYGETAGRLAALWVAIGPLLLLTWGAKAYTGYLLDLVLGTAILFLTWTLGEEPPPRHPWGRLLGIGWLGGFGIWCHPIIAPYLVVSGLALLLTARRHLTFRGAGVLLGGGLVGAAPFIYYNLLHAGSTAAFLAVSAQTGSPFRFVSRLYNAATGVIPVLLGGGMPWSYRRAEQSYLLSPSAESALFIVLVAAALIIIARSLRRRMLIPAVVHHAMMGASVVCLLLAGADALRAWALTSVDPERARLADLGQPLLIVWIFLGTPLVIAAFRLFARGGETGVTARRPSLMLWGLAGATLLLFCLTRFGDMRSPRFLFPLYTAVPLLITSATVGGSRLPRVIARIGLGLSIGLNLLLFSTVPTGILQQPAHYVPGQLLPEENEDLIAYLEETGRTRLHAKYWLGTPLIFQSREAIITSDGRPGRYAPYHEAVSAAPEPVFLFHRGAPEQIDLERVLMGGGLHCDRADISIYRLYTRCDDEVATSVMPGYLLSP